MTKVYIENDKIIISEEYKGIKKEFSILPSLKEHKDYKKIENVLQLIKKIDLRTRSTKDNEFLEAKKN